MSELRQYLTFIRPWDDLSHKVVTSQWDALDPNGKPEKRMLMRGAVNLDDVVAIIQYYDGRGQNVWFSTQTFTISDCAIAVGMSGKWFKKVNRKQQFVRALYVFYADLDVKPGAYATLQDAVNAIYAFCAKINLPPPSLLVCSGYGLHVYWRLEEGVTPQQWLPLSSALRNAMMVEGIHADHAVTIDSARILRPPGTRNWKDPKNPVVTYIVPGSSFQVYPLDWMATPLAPFRGPHIATVNGQPVAAQAQGAPGLNRNFMAGVGEAPPIDLSEVATECPVFEEQFRLHGAGASQPLWSLVAMASAFDRTPWDTFKALSDGYANYDENAARQKLAEKMTVKGRTGWPSCNAFASESPLCATCPHFTAGKSPLNLKAKPVVNLASIPGIACMLPPPYYQETDGTIWGNLKDAKGVPTQTCIFKYPVANGALDNENGELVFQATIWPWPPGRYFRLKMDRVRAADVRQQLSVQGMESFEHEAKRLGDFVMAWVAHLKAQKAPNIRSNSLGWNDDGSFTHGETTWKAGVASKAYYRDDTLVKRYSVKGSPKPWQDLMSRIYAEHLPSMETIVATAFGSPLVKFISNGSLMLSPYSPMSAAGKTTAMKAAQGVWGHPVLGMSSLDDTTAFVNKKVETLRHLPLYWDEIRTKKLLDQLIVTVFRMSQGKDRDRLQADISVRDTNSHAALMVACSNHSLSEQVIGSTIDSDAGANRVLEILMPSLAKRPTTSDFDNAIIMMSNDGGHYGHAGAAYAEWLSVHRDRAAAEVLATRDRLMQILKAPPAERFWVATIAAVVCGAQFANDAGITHFNVKAIMTFLVEAVKDLRAINAEDVSSVSTAINIEEILSAILSSGNVIFTDILSRQGGVNRANLVNNQTVEHVTRMVQPWAQLAVNQDILRIEMVAFKRWLLERGHSPRIVINELLKYGTVKSRGAIGAGVPGFNAIGAMRPRCLDIPLATIRAATP